MRFSQEEEMLLLDTRMHNRADQMQFTPREHDVAFHLIRGVYQTEIAAKLGISPGTVNQHVKNMCLKARANNSGVLVAKLLALLPIPEEELNLACKQDAS